MSARVRPYSTIRCGGSGLRCSVAGALLGESDPPGPWPTVAAQTHPSMQDCLLEFSGGGLLHEEAFSRKHRARCTQRPSPCFVRVQAHLTRAPPHGGGAL